MKRLVVLLICFLSLCLVVEGSARSKRILGKKARPRGVSGTVTLNTSDFGRFVTVDTSGGVAEVTLPSPSASTKNYWLGILRDGGSGVSLIVLSGSIDFAGSTGTRFYNHPSNETGSNVLLIWGGVSGESVFVVSPNGTWGLK